MALCTSRLSLIRWTTELSVVHSARGGVAACFLAAMTLCGQPLHAQQPEGADRTHSAGETQPSSPLDTPIDNDAPHGLQSTDQDAEVSADPERDSAPWLDQTRDDQLLRDLTEQGLDLPAQSSSNRRPTLEEEVLDQLKDMLRDIDPREGLNLDLSTTSDNRGDEAESNSSAVAIPSTRISQDRRAAAGENAPYGAPQTEQRGGTIAELGDLLRSLLSDFRLYAYLLLSLGMIAGGFGVVAIIKLRHDKRRLRRTHRRNSRRRRSHRHFREAERRRREANRDLATP